jgi:hypothetical protein
VNERRTGTAGFDGPASVVDAQVDAMSQRVSKDRDRRCAQLRSDALGQARDILRAARKEARANVSDAVALERKHGEQALRQAQASALLEARQRDQQETRVLLQEMWTAIPSALESRWADPARRKAWVQAAVRQAQALLGGRAWRIEHGAGWSQDELGELMTLVAGRDKGAPVHEVPLVCDNEIRAGIRINAEGACLDATTAGLLASRAQVESEFLAQYLTLSSGPEHAAHE